MKLLALVLLLSSFSSLTLAEVVSSFKDNCSSFFIPNPNKQNDNIIPTIFPGRQYKTICQRWKNVYRFATVYDTEMRIPFYSAYTFQEKEETGGEEIWKIEPQLENIEEYKDKTEMMDSPSDTDPVITEITNQAVNLDYKESGYDRGHVFPKLFAANQDQIESTFTLTNVAPQLQASNNAWAKQVETPMLNLIKAKCSLNNHMAYIVTGVIPGNDWTPVKETEKDKKSINIPTHYWSAFCCHSKKKNSKLIGKAYLAEQKEFNLWTSDIDNLNEKLTDLYNKKIPFSVFGDLKVEDAKSGFNLESVQTFLQIVINALYDLSARLFSEL